MIQNDVIKYKNNSWYLEKNEPKEGKIFPSKNQAGKAISVPIKIDFKPKLT